MTAETQIHAVLHMPKTGGTVLADLIAAHLPPDYLFIRSNVRAEVELRLRGDLSKYRAVIVYGHLALGLADAYGPVKYYTMLREPVERAVSDYFMTIDPGTGHFLYERAAVLPCGEFVRQLLPSNPQCRYLCGNPPHLLSYPLWRALPVTDVELSLAIDRLRHFTFVGLQRRYVESARTILGHLGIDAPVEPVAGTRAGRQMTQLGEDELSLIYACNQQDDRLYKWVLRHSTWWQARFGRPELL